MVNVKKKLNQNRTNNHSNQLEQMQFTHFSSSSEDDEHGVLSLSSSNIERRRLAIVLNQKANSIDSKVQCFAFLFSQNENYDFAAISMATKSLTNNTRTKYSS